ncbi:MAG: ECF transporter S component [Clostridia bacterium]|nr:ECF transporter S component [Clostridia bacterium]
MSNVKKQTQKLALGALFTALVIVLQVLGAFVRFGPFSISLVLVPIVIGSAVCGYKIGAWLGFVFGAAVLISGDAAAFLAVDVLGTILTVLIKGTLCGLAAGLAYKAFSRVNTFLGVVSAALVCPIVNTGIFLVGCFLFFMEPVTAWAAALNFENVGSYMIFGLVGGNFLFELGANIVLAPVIIRLIKLIRKS